MNIFRFAGDMSHLFSVIFLLLKIYATKSCSGISLKTQELCALVFVTRYMSLFTSFVSVYNTVMKVVFISSSIAIVWCMRRHHLVSRSYDKGVDAFRHYWLVVGCLVLGVVFHDDFPFMEACKELAREILHSCRLSLEEVGDGPKFVVLLDPTQPQAQAPSQPPTQAQARPSHGQQRKCITQAQVQERA